MPQRTRAAGLACAAALAFAAVAPAQEHDEHDQRTVRILDGRLAPQVVEVDRQDAIAWQNDSGHAVVVWFDREVGRTIQCRAPGGFQLTDERLASRPVRSRGFVTLCPLMPGEYDYRVERLPRAESGGAVEPGLAGRIVVLGSPDPPPVGAVP